MLANLSEKEGSIKGNNKNPTNISAPPGDFDANDEGYDQLLDENAPMERVVRYIIDKMKIPNYSWMKANETSYQINFSIETGSKCDDVVHMFSEWGIGQRDGSSISIVPCTLYYDPILGHEEVSDDA